MWPVRQFVPDIARRYREQRDDARNDLKQTAEALRLMTERALEAERMEAYWQRKRHASAQLVAETRDDLEMAVAALRVIALGAVQQRNPDGVDQAAVTMQRIAREALKRLDAA